jgi:NAD(P)-dependent dehydrogenase (short-subunit alcohol dehydrogenase family)
MAQKVWMITGASRGLGAEIAKAALAAGEKLIATGRGKDGLKFSSDQDALFSVEMDVTNEAQIRSGVRDSISRFGRIDVLVNNANFSRALPRSNGAVNYGPQTTWRCAWRRRA